MANRYTEVTEHIEKLKPDFKKFYEDNVQAAGTRLRKGMQELKVLAQNIRKEVQEKKNSQIDHKQK